jgi:HlyD family secretion protein
MKRNIKLSFILAALSLSLLLVTACSPAGGKGTVSQVAVTKGDIIISVSGSGRIEASHEARLTFGSTGKVEKILVKEGEGVKAGDVLARLDTSALELALAQSQLAVTQAEVALTQAQLAQKTAENSLKSTRGSEDALKLALFNAQIARDQAQRYLDAGVTAVDYDLARAELDKAQAWYQYVQDRLKEGVGSVDDWLLAEDEAKEKLDTAQANYDSTLAGYGTQEIVLRKKQVEAADMAVAQAQKNLDDLTDTIALQELQVTSANQTVMQYHQSVELALKSLDEAQKQLEEATIVAPFDGMVASVMVKEGDIVPSPSMVPQTIIYIIDPNLMELVVDVDEIDVPRLVLGQTAVITLDALPGKEFPGAVTAIYPVPREEGGVVLYETRLSLDVPEGSGIKVGMSASADVLIEKRSGVLLVPSRAIQKDSQGQAIVKVMAGKQVEERPVVVGLDDGLRAEVISGLNEGETVVIETKAKA